MPRSDILRFDVAGVRRGDDIVFLTSEHRTYVDTPTIFHRNDYHTIVVFGRHTFKEHFRYNYSTGIYENLSKLTWDQLKQVAHVKIFDLVDDECIEEVDHGKVIGGTYEIDS